ncbi:cache domain-containing protein [Methylicorpusculum sp.]|uniref:cache domain-containing protein n=1 Tax=Methylicorpusculum sp. TaxID=2713644 RepID=UPI002ABBE563|nr:cache domain-containing protein [Methylicorpusculum sp.]MDZ4149593.1 cache domain-containing protein [Methylicorpusculum sp.]
MKRFFLRTFLGVVLVLVSHCVWAPQSAEISGAKDQLLLTPGAAVPEQKKLAPQSVLPQGAGITVGPVSTMPDTPIKTSARPAEAIPKNGSQFLPEAHSFVEPADYGTLKGSASEEKKKELIALVHKAIDVIQKTSIAKALDLINRSPEFKKAELYLYVYDVKGTLLANGDDMSEVWKNQYAEKDEFGSNPVRGLIETALKGGGWHIYRWHHGTKAAYVMLTEKDSQKYVVGGGYFPSSKTEYVLGLVKSAVSTYTSLVEKGYSKETVWGMFSYPLGKFVYGDIFLTVLDSKGVTLADGQRPGMVGESVWDSTDDTGENNYRTIITHLNKKQPAEGVWFQSTQNNALKSIYAERIVDKQGENIYFMSGYYPDANREAAVNLVKKGAVFLNTFGAEETAKKIARAELIGSVDALQNYVYGDLTIFVYDMQGVCIAHGENREAVGKNHIEMRDEGGRFIVKELIEKAKREGSGWLDFRMKNAFWNVYVERVNIGKQSFVVGCGLYPTTKREMMLLMAKSAAEYLKAHEDKKAFYDFVTTDGLFVQGDLGVFVLDTTGVCYAWGDRRNLVWQNLSSKVDQEGRPYIKILINTAKKGPGIVSAQENNARKFYYVEPVVKGDKTYIVGSSYYQ